MFKKKKTEQFIEVGVVDGAGMTEIDLFKGELRYSFFLDMISH